MESLDRAVSYFLLHERCGRRRQATARQGRHQTSYAWKERSWPRSFTEVSEATSPFGGEESENEKAEGAAPSRSTRQLLGYGRPTRAGEAASKASDGTLGAAQIPRALGPSEAKCAEPPPGGGRGETVQYRRGTADAEKTEEGGPAHSPSSSAMRQRREDKTHKGDRNGMPQPTASSSVPSPVKPPADSSARRAAGIVELRSSDPPGCPSGPRSTPGSPPTGTTLQVFRDRRTAAAGADRGRRLTFRMKETPDVTLLLQDPEQALQETRQRCGIDIAPEREASLDGDWDESSMDLPVQQRELSDEKFREMLKYELKLANDETDTLVRDIFASNSSGGSSLGRLTNGSISSEWLTETQAGVFDTDMLVDWYNRVAESFRQGVRLVKVSMTGKKYLRTVKIDQDFFSVSLPNGGFRHTHLCYMNGAKLGYASGEFMHLIETTDVGAEVPMVQVCGVVRMPSRSVSLIFPSESVRNELILLVRVKIRMAKYMFGDGSPSVLRANTKGTELRPMETLRRLEDSEFFRNNTEETTDEATRASPR